jgi:hypothetical protein
MGQELEKKDDQVSFELRRWVGRRDAFAAVAGMSLAAEAQSLRRIRDEKLYLQLDMTWDEFCSKRAGCSRRQVERFLRPLDEFVLTCYLVAQIAHVTPEEYRLIAPHITAEGIHLDGAVVPLLPQPTEPSMTAVSFVRPAVKSKSRTTGLDGSSCLGGPRLPT